MRRCCSILRKCGFFATWPRKSGCVSSPSRSFCACASIFSIAFHQEAVAGFCWNACFVFIRILYTSLIYCGHLATKFSICEQGEIFRVFYRQDLSWCEDVAWFCGKAGTLLLTKKFRNRDPSREFFSRFRHLLDRFLSRIYHWMPFMHDN